MNKTQRFRLLGTVIFLLLLGLFVSKIVFDQIKDRQESVQTIMVNVLHGMHSNIEQLIGIVSRSLNTFQTDMPEWLESNRGKIHAEQRLLAFKMAMPSIEEVSIFDTTGKIWASTEENKTIVSLTQVELQEINSKNDFSSNEVNPFVFILEPVRNNDNACSMSLVIPISLPEKNFQGGILAVLPTHFFLPVMKTALLSDDSMSGITWNKKTVLFQISKYTFTMCFPVSEKNNFLISHFDSGSQLSILTDKNSSTNSKRIVAMYTIRGTDLNWSADLTLTIGREYSNIISILNDSARSYILLYFLICILALGSMALLHNLERKTYVAEMANQKNLEYLAQYDNLTGLPNRTHAFDHLKDAIARTNRKDLYLAVMFIDLDGFKEVNDTWGHDSGDHLLRCIAANMKSVLRDSDTLARLGGDEFIAIIEDISSKEVCSETAIRLIEYASKNVNIRAKNNIVSVSVTASIGIILDTTKKLSTHELIKAADTAMYEAKQNGKNRFAFYKE